MLVMDIFIFTGVLNVPIFKKNIPKSIIIQQFVSTMISIISATAKMWMESTGLEENIMEYIMLSLKAK